ncbi:MAG: histidine kinase [Bacteroidetes bacterium]|nr:histidine kinase [Bacteroidota bacterium]
MKKRLFANLLFFIFALPCYSRYGNNIDQYIAQVKDASYYDSTKLFNIGEETISKAMLSSTKAAVAEVHLYYGNYFFYVRNLNKAKLYFELAQSEAKKWENPHIETLARIRLAFLEYENGNQEQAEKELDELLIISKQSEDFENVAELLNLKGILKEENNDEKSATKLYLEGLTISEIHNLNYYSGVFRNNLGLIKLGLGQIKEALDDFEKGLKIAEKENSKRLVGHIQMNICLAYVSDNKPEKAYELFEKVIQYSRQNNLPQELASNYINLASAFSNTGKNEKALAYIDSAIVVLQLHDFKTELTTAYLNKVNVFISIKKIDEAEKLLQKIKLLTKETGNLEALSSYYLMEYRIDSDKKNYKEALGNYLSFAKIKDSLSGQINNKVVAELQQNQRIQKKEIELEKERTTTILLEKSNQEERYLKWISIGTAIIFIILIISLSSLRYSKKIKEKQQQFSQQLIQNIEEERLRISRDLHDDIGQSLSVIKAKIIKEKQNSKEPSDILENELGRVIEQTREISRNLYPTHLEKIGLSRSVAALLESIQSATKLECSFEIADVLEQFPIPVQTHLFRIIQECTNNTIKHSGATGLKISILEKAGEFVMIYQDNGIGLKVKKLHLGLGLLSMQERAKIIQGTLNFDDKVEKGFKLILKFKLAKKQTT